VTPEEELTADWHDLMPDDVTPMGDNALDSMAELNDIEKTD